MRDATGADVGPIIEDAATTHGIPVLLLLACAKAESATMDPNAFRDDGPADTSVGPFQQVIVYAGGYGIGDGSYSAANIALCRKAFADWATASRVAATHLADDLAAAKALYPNAEEDELLLLALSRYNSGGVQEPGNWWWVSYQHAGYAAALAWAKLRA